MENNEFDLFKDVELTEEQKRYLDNSKKVSDLIIKMIKKRMELNMSQRDLAEKTGIKQPMIARIEKLETIPRLDTLTRIVSALGMNLCFEESVNVIVHVEITKRIDYRSDNLTAYSSVPVMDSKNEFAYQA